MFIFTGNSAAASDVSTVWQLKRGWLVYTRGVVLGRGGSFVSDLPWILPMITNW
jgi:hypothetical protein